MTGTPIVLPDYKSLNPNLIQFLQYDQSFSSCRAFGDVRQKTSNDPEHHKDKGTLCATSIPNQIALRFCLRPTVSDTKQGI